MARKMLEALKSQLKVNVLDVQCIEIVVRNVLVKQVYFFLNLGSSQSIMIVVFICAHSTAHNGGGQ